MDVGQRRERYQEISTRSSGVANFEGDPFAEYGEGRLDLVQARVVVEVEEPVDGGLRYAETARQFGLAHTGSLEHLVEGCLGCIKGWHANKMVLPSARFTGVRNLLAL